MMRPHMPVLIEEKVRVFVAGLAVPGEFVKSMHDHGMKIVVMCGKVHHGEKAQAAGADVVVAQGTEAGGHTGEIGMISLVPQMIDAVRLPVLAAGGIAHGQPDRGRADARSAGRRHRNPFYRDARSAGGAGVSRIDRKGARGRHDAHPLRTPASPVASSGRSMRWNGRGPCEDSAVPDAGADLDARTE